jgi:hypothetical protein
MVYLESKLIRAHVITDAIIDAEKRMAQLPAQAATPGEPVPLETDKLPPSAAGIQEAETASVRIVDRMPGPFPQVEADAKQIRRNSPGNVAGGRNDGLEKADMKIPAEREISQSGDKVDPEKSAGLAAAAGMQQTQKARDATRNEDRPPSEIPDAGQWVINLASLPSEVDAERFMQDARSRGFVTRQQQVMVAGKPYWRVQTHGFTSSQAARTYSETIRQQLGLKDVWIMKRSAR